MGSWAFHMKGISLCYLAVQKIHLGFSVPSYAKIWTKFLANPIVPKRKPALLPFLASNACAPERGQHSRNWLPPSQAFSYTSVPSSFVNPESSSQVAQWYRILLPMQEIQVQSLGWEDPREGEMATHSTILVWEIPWTGGPGGLQSMGSQKSRTRLREKQTKPHIKSMTILLSRFNLALRSPKYSCVIDQPVPACSTYP